MRGGERLPCVAPPTSEAELLARATALVGRWLRGELAQAVGIAPPGVASREGLCGGAARMPARRRRRLPCPSPTLRARRRIEASRSMRRACRSSRPSCASPGQGRDGSALRGVAGVWKKLARVLWMPVEAEWSLPLSARRPRLAAAVEPGIGGHARAQNWEELMELLTAGGLGRTRRPASAATCRCGRRRRTRGRSPRATTKRERRPRRCRAAFTCAGATRGACSPGIYA